MKKRNRLAGEKSPYLLQHRHNPVDWFPWGQEAFEKAWAEEKPIFLSIGYSTCHWCHVIEWESFENNELKPFYGGTYFPSPTVLLGKSSAVCWRMHITILPSSASLPTKVLTWPFLLPQVSPNPWLLPANIDWEKPHRRTANWFLCAALKHSLNRCLSASKCLSKHVSIIWKMSILMALYWRSASKH